VVIIGVDPHKRQHTATAVEAGRQRVLGTVEIEADLPGYRRLLRWAQRYESRRWEVENAHGLGRHLAQWLIARGEAVCDVPSTATARVRELSRGGRRKNDVIDAAAAACVAALVGDGLPVAAEDASTVLAMLDERRGNVVGHRTRLVNQLHALFRDLVPGGAQVDLTVAAARRVLLRVRPTGPVEVVRKQLAHDLIAEIADCDARLAALTKQIAAAVDQTDSRLLEVAPVLARFAGFEDRLVDVPPGEFDEQSLQALPTRRDRSAPSAARAVRTTTRLLIGMAASWCTRCARRPALSLCQCSLPPPMRRARASSLKAARRGSLTMTAASRYSSPLWVSSMSAVAGQCGDGRTGRQHHAGQIRQGYTALTASNGKDPTTTPVGGKRRPSYGHDAPVPYSPGTNPDYSASAPQQQEKEFPSADDGAPSPARG